MTAHVQSTDLPASFDFSATGDTLTINPGVSRDTITCLRSVLMKPEHREWIDPIWEILDQATRAVLVA